MEDDETVGNMSLGEEKLHRQGFGELTEGK